MCPIYSPWGLGCSSHMKSKIHQEIPMWFSQPWSITTKTCMWCCAWLATFALVSEANASLTLASGCSRSCHGRNHNHSAEKTLHLWIQVMLHSGKRQFWYIDVCRTTVNVNACDSSKMFGILSFISRFFHQPSFGFGDDFQATSGQLMAFCVPIGVKIYSNMCCF